MAITYKKHAKGYKAYCGEVSAIGATAEEAIEKAHARWWKRHAKEIDECIGLLNIEGKNTKEIVRDRLEGMM